MLVSESPVGYFSPTHYWSILAQIGRIKVYSFLTLLGHDLGIEAILVVLGIKMDHHVPYASRLVFEYWTEKQTETTKIRKRFSTSDYQLNDSYSMSQTV